jgi:hypothetical protein
VDAQKGSIVTVDLGNQASNTFIVDTVEQDTVLLSHPLAKSMLLRVRKDQLNSVNPNMKDSNERHIDFCNQNVNCLDFNSRDDLEAIGTHFAFKRRLTPKQKSTLAGISGFIARVKFNQDLREAMYFITKNSSMLDEFNRMWFINFQGVFKGTTQITSGKQVNALFNMAGYLLAQLENPTASARK